MFTKLDCSIKDITNIVHIADVHIKLTQREIEYREVFNKLYKEIEKTPQSTLIAVLGDTLHNKQAISPESLQMASEFFSSLANLRPTIVVAGNHDANLSSTSRLDSISPIIYALNNPNLYYLRNSGLYGIGNVLFSVCSVFDPDKFVSYDNIPKVYINQYHHHIAMYHGVVDGTKGDNGFTLNNLYVKKDTFDGYHMVLLGDIHLPQTLYMEKTINKSELDDYLQTGEWELVTNF